MPSFELKLSTRKVVVWEGIDGVDAAHRYVDCHRDATVIAWRTTPRTGLFVFDAERVDRIRIIEPTPGMGG